jgi:hypothetical protein
VIQVDIYKGMGFTLEGAEDAKTVSGGETKIYVMLKHTAKNV